MKSRTSFFNPAAFKKDITRFAPAWVLYTVGLFMILTAIMIDNFEYYRASGLAGSLGFMAVINLCYGFLNGQLLFGDLFSARHCNALHAMPLRRECWFVTHTVSGLLFALVPNALMALVSMTMLGGGWTVALWWYLAAALQYLFFFGLAVLSALSVGNRFAMTLVYGIVNFFALIIYWFYYTIYEPLLYGVNTTQEPFLLFCPVWQMADSYGLIEVGRRSVETSFRSEYYVKSVTLGEGWGYLAICACLGVALLGIALVLYRRRKLESAGDFMAVRALEPVFLVLYTMCAAAFFQVFADLFGANEYVFLSLGLIIGFFTGRMLLMRTTRVFQPRGFMWFGILAAAFLLSMLLTWLDPLGVTRYIPDADDVSAVKISNSFSSKYDKVPILSETEDIDTVRRIHQLILDGKIREAEGVGEDYYNNLSILYELDSGITVTRKYEIACTSPAGELVRSLYTRAEYVLGTDDVDEFMLQLNHVYCTEENSSVNGEIEYLGRHRDYIRGLVEAILADCAEGTMAQNYGFHAGEEQFAWVEFSLTSYEDGYELYDYRNVTIYSSNRHTMAYLEENPFPVGENNG